MNKGSRVLNKILGLEGIDFEKAKNFKKLYNLMYLMDDEEYGKEKHSLSFFVLFNSDLNDTTTVEGFIERLVQLLSGEQVPPKQEIIDCLRREEWKKNMW